MSKIDHSSFSTSSLPVEQRFHVWRESISVLFDVKLPGTSHSDDFNTAMNSYLIGDQCALSVCQTGAQAFERSDLRAAKDGMDYYLLQILLNGSQRVHRHGKEQSFRPGSLLMIDLTAPHRAESQDVGTLNMVVPRHILAPHLRHPDSHGSRVINADVPLVTLLRNHMMTFYNTMTSLTVDQAITVIAPTMGLVASVLNGSPYSAEEAVGSGNSIHLMRAKTVIESLLQQDLTVDALSTQLNMSTATLYRLFERYGGVRSYIQERRLRRCAEALMQGHFPHWRVCDVAHYWGFKSEAHFCRAFKQRFGVSPSEARYEGSARLRKPTAATSLDPRVGDRDYEHWLVSTLRA